MKATYRMENVDKIEATMTITMTIAEWRKLSSVVEDGFPGRAFRNRINRMLEIAHKAYEVEYGDERNE